MFYLGIDQHAKQLTINLRDEEGNAVLKRQVSTRPEKVLHRVWGIQHPEDRYESSPSRTHEEMFRELSHL